MTEPMSANHVAASIKPLLDQAKHAYGSQPPGSPAREASEKVNEYILNYADRGGKIPELAEELNGELSLSGLRRRLRIARAQETSQAEGTEQVVGRTTRPRGNRDPQLIEAAVEEIQQARSVGGRVYGDSVRKAHDQGLSLGAIADKIGISYYSLWSAKRTSW